jgi:leucyl/phenylalanyl-tRNA--protein transferase
VFFGESMFTRDSDASKVAFVRLVRQLRACGFPLIDCQVHSEHLARFGARAIARSEFVALLDRHAAAPGIPAPWRFDDADARRKPGDSTG